MQSPKSPKHVVALSGGKDSTALALALRERNPGVVYEFVCTPTGDELPPMQEHWRRLEALLGPVKKLPGLSLLQLIEREQMIPNFRARFCTRHLKIEPFMEYMESLPAGSVMYVGIRKDEEDRLGMVTDADDTFEVRKPFLDWGWGLKEVKEYLACRGVEIPKRTDCGSCFYQRLGEWRDLWEEYPSRYDQYVEIEDRIGHTFRSPQRDTWPADLRSLRAEFERGRPVRQVKKKDAELAACPWCAK